MTKPFMGPHRPKVDTLPKARLLYLDEKTIWDD